MTKLIMSLIAITLAFGGISFLSLAQEKSPQNNQSRLDGSDSNKGTNDQSQERPSNESDENKGDVLTNGEKPSIGDGKGTFHGAGATCTDGEEVDVSIELCFPTADNAETGNQMCCVTECYQACEGGVWLRPEECGIDTKTCSLGKNEDIEVVDIR